MKSKHGIMNRITAILLILIIAASGTAVSEVAVYASEKTGGAGDLIISEPEKPDQPEAGKPEEADEQEDISDDLAPLSSSRTVKASSLADNSDLVLTGDTTLVVDEEKKLRTITGNYDLTIDGDKTLTLRRAGKVIDVKNLTVNAPLDITGGNDAAVYAGETVYVNNDLKIDAVTGIQANYAIVLNKGKIILTTGLRSIWSENGSVTIRTIVFASSKDQDVINAAHSIIFENAFADLISNGNAKSAVYANHDIVVTGGRVGAEGTVAFNSRYGSIDLNGTIVAKSGSRPAIYAQEGSVTLAGDVTADSKITDIWAKKDIIVKSGTVATSGPRGILSDEGAITITGNVHADASKKNAITAKKDIIIRSGSDVYADCGKNSAAIQSYSGNISIESNARVKAYGAREAITADSGYVALEGDVEARSAGWAVWSDMGIFITGGKTEAESGCAIWTGGPVTIYGDVDARSTGDGAVGISATSVLISKGTVTAQCASNGAAIRARTGDIKIGRNATVKARGAREGISSEEGSITIEGNVEATASGWPIWAKNKVDINDGCVKTAGSSGGASGITASGTISIRPPLMIVVPEGGRISADGRKIVTGDNKNASTTEIKAVPIPGTAEIMKTETYAGETLSLKTTGVPDPYQIQWQKSPDNDAWVNVTGSSGNICPTKAGDAGYFFRAVVTAAGYGGEVISGSRLVQAIPALTGSVVYTGGNFTVGKNIGTGFTGGVLEVYKASPDSVHYKWQRSGDGNTGWADIPGAVSAGYTPVASDADKYIRVAVTADRHSGALYSAKRKIRKNSNEAAPVEPQLAVSSPYSQVTVTNAKEDQEYVAAYPAGYGTPIPDWTSAAHPDSDGSFKVNADKDRTVIVFTRMRETDTREAGTKTASCRIYNGYITSLADLTLDKTEVTTRAGEVTKLTVSPLPGDFSGWNDEYTVSWYVNGSGVTLWTNPECYIPMPGGPTSHKSAYVKAASQTSYAEVSVEKQVGYSDLKRASCSFEVTDAEGNHILQHLYFEDMILWAGETVTTEYAVSPSPALVGTLSFVKNSGPSTALTLAESSKGTVMISAPEDAEPGDYYYGVKVDGNDTYVLSAVKITVLSTRACVTLSPNNGDPSEEIKEIVDIGSQFILPEMPDGFSKPDGYDFDGWDKGDVGDGVIVDGNITIKAQWKVHVHTLEHVDAFDPTCTWDGNLEYWYCTACHKEFYDKDGISEAPVGAFILPAKGHTPGTPKREFEIPCDEENDGSYDEVTVCSVCMEEISRTHVTVERRILEEISLTADTAEDGSGPRLNNTGAALVWMDGLTVASNRYDISDAVRPGKDENCTDFYSSWSAAGNCYVKYTVSNKTAGDSSLIFTRLEKDNCKLIVPGYNAECLGTKSYISGEKVCADILFGLEKKKEYAIKPQPEKYASSVTLNEDGSYLTPADQGIILYNTGLKDVTFNYINDPYDSASTVSLSGEDKDVFTVSPIGSFPVSIPAGGSVAVCGVNAKNGLELIPNHVYTARLTLKTDHAAEGAAVTIPLSFGTAAPAMTGIWMKDIPAQVYTGKKIMPSVEVYWGETLLTGNDYSISYKNNKDVYLLTEGQAGFDARKAPRVTIKGRGNFKGKFTRTFVIGEEKSAVTPLPETVKKLSGASVITYPDLGYKESCAYSGSEITQPEGSYALSFDKGKTFIPASCYKVTYENNISRGTARMVIKGREELGYSGSLVKTFKITGYDIKSDPGPSYISLYYTDGGTEHAWNEDTAPVFLYNSGGVKPEPVVRFGSNKLQKGTDYTVSWTGNSGLKETLNGKKDPVVRIKGKGNFTGFVERTFRIGKKPFTDAYITVIASDIKWQDRSGICSPDVKVIEKLSGRTLKAGTDYYAPDDKLYPFVYEFVSVPSGKKVYDHDRITKTRTEVDPADTAFGKPVRESYIIPEGTVISVTLRGKGAYEENLIKGEFKYIDKEMNMGSGAFRVRINPVQWTGQPVILTGDDITVTRKISRTETKTLVFGTDYEIVPGSYVNNINRGSARVTIRGLDNGTDLYGGTKQVTFKIVPRRMNYMITYDRNEARLRDLMWGRLTAAQQGEALAEYSTKEKWFADNYRITGVMKASETPYNGKIIKNAYKVQKYNRTSGKWNSLPVTDAAFKGWAIKEEGGVLFADKAVFKPSWLWRLIYDDDVTLYAVW